VSVYNLFDGGFTDSELAERHDGHVTEGFLNKMRKRWEPAPVPEIQVHADGEFAYWQHPETDWVEMVGDND
jgi:hypothetical protein